VHLMREEKTSRGLAELMKELVLASGAPDETRKTLREKIDIVCRNSKEKEHSRKIEEFTFTKARRSIEDWEAELKRSDIHPTKDIISSPNMALITLTHVRNHGPGRKTRQAGQQ